jgi:hypothetical protein
MEDPVTKLREQFARVIAGKPEPVDELVIIWLYDPVWEAMVAAKG